MKMVVYTVLVGDKEALNDPLQYVGGGANLKSGTDLELDFVCFTDRQAPTSPSWTFRDMPSRLIPPDKLSRLPKALPHKFFEDYEYSLYIDNTVVFKRLPQHADLGQEIGGQEIGAIFRAYRHPWRVCPQDEADVVVRSGLDEAETVAAQTRFYDRRRPLRAIPVLTAGTALLRRHHDSRVRLFGELWWEQILLFSARDQISLDQCALEASCPIDHFPGDKINSDLIVWPALSSPRRVEATFDADRYAWEKRDDPEARARPRAHYLAHGGVSKYERSPSWFRYCCARVGSGLDQRTAPRRGLADILDPLLRAMMDNPGGILLVAITSNAAWAADGEELARAEEAIRLFFRFNPAPLVLSAGIPAEELADRAPFRAAHGVTGFRLVVVLGLPPVHHPNALAKFFTLLVPEGTLLLQFGAGLSIEEIGRMQDGLGEPCTLSVFHGQHIAHTGAIPSSVFMAHRVIHQP